jgi:hypothetical protein
MAPKKTKVDTRGRLNNTNIEAAKKAPDVVLGTFLVNFVPTRVLFDSGASHSFELNL